MHLAHGLLLGGLVFSFSCPAFAVTIVFLGTLGQGAGGGSGVSLPSDELLALGTVLGCMGGKQQCRVVSGPVLHSSPHR